MNAPGVGALAEGDTLWVGSDDGLAGEVGVALPGTSLAEGGALSVAAGLPVGAALGLAVVTVAVELGVELGPAPVGDAVCAAVHATVTRTTASSASLFTRAWCRNQPIGAYDCPG